MEDDDDIKQMAQSHKHYLSAMIAEQEAALSRFQNSAYLSDSNVNTSAFASSTNNNRRGGPSTNALNNSSINLSGSASPYTFNRMSSSSRGGIPSAPTPGYSSSRPGAAAGMARPSSPTPSTSSAGSGINNSIMQNARRTLAEAASWGEGEVGSHLPRHTTSSHHHHQRTSTGFSASSPNHHHHANLNDTAMSTATITSELETKMWNKDKAAWEKRMAELEERLKRVNSVAQTQQAAVAAQSASPQPINVPVVNGRAVQSGANALIQSSTTSHNVHTSSLVLRLEQELATAVEALVRERQATAAREVTFQEQIKNLEEEVNARERKAQTLNTKWMGEFESQSHDYQEQLEKAYAKTQSVVAQLEEKDNELNNRLNDLKKTQQKVTQDETEMRELQTQIDDLRNELDKQTRRAKDLDLLVTNLEFEKKGLVNELENKSKSFHTRTERSKEEWLARLERQKEELNSQHDKELRSSQKETAEMERKFREVEHDAFVLSSELNKWKDQVGTKDMEIDKWKNLLELEKTSHQTLLKNQIETSEVNTKITLQKMQSTLDESHAVLLDTTSKLENETRKNREFGLKIEALESELRSKGHLIMEKDAQIAAKENRVQSVTQTAAEHERSSQNQAGLVAQLKTSNAHLTEELAALQKKLETRSASKNDEVRSLETEHRKYREKQRTRIEDLEKQLEDLRKGSSQLSQRNEHMKNDFDVALHAATSEQANVIHNLERKIEKLQSKLSVKNEHAMIHANEKDQIMDSMQTELDRRAHAESVALMQLQELEGRYKKERTRFAELEAKFNHMTAVAPDANTHQRVLAELAAAKQVATNIQGRYRELQAKFERQSVRQDALQKLLNRLQEEQMAATFRNPAKSYLAAPNLPLYRPLHNYPAITPSAASMLDDSYSIPTSSLAPPSAAVANSLAHATLPPHFSNEEEEMYGALMRDQQRQRRVRAHVRAFSRGEEFDSDDDHPSAGGNGSTYAAARSTYNSRVRSRSVPRASRDDYSRDDSYSFSSPSRYSGGGSGSTSGTGGAPRSSLLRRTKDDADVNLNLQVNFDPRVLKKMKELDCFPACVHSSLKPHDTRSCKVCQRRAFGKGMDRNLHYADQVHLPSRSSPSALRAALEKKLPHD